MVKLPADIVEEASRLGESLKAIELVADSEGIDFARYFLSRLSDSARVFEEWFPRLTAFADAKRSEHRLPFEQDLTTLDCAIRQILEPKVVGAERVPVRNHFTAAIFTAPIVMHSLLKIEWPAAYPNAVFLTPMELREWNEIYTGPEDSCWWYVMQDWDVVANPEPSSFWMQHCRYAIPDGSIPLLVSWGLQWGSMAGGQRAELWHLPQGGTAQRLGSLGDCSF